MDDINKFLDTFQKDYSNISLLNASGSGRSNYRFEALGKSYILTLNDNIAENNAFFYLSKLFQQLNAQVPEVLHISADRKMYVQTDLGNQTLLELRLSVSDQALPYYEKAVKKLAHLQIGAAQIVDKDKLYDVKVFDKMLVYRDLFYFKNYFLDFTSIPYAQSKLLQEFEHIAENLKNIRFEYLMLRDFQGRNIMVKEDQPYFIDYQDAMIGPIAYDLVSLLWQAKANLTVDEKSRIYNVYTDEVKSLIPNKFDNRSFIHDYNICTLIRLMQVLGAYGKLGLIQNKPHFKESIASGKENLFEFSKNDFMQKFPILKNIFVNLNDEQLSKVNL